MPQWWAVKRTKNEGRIWRRSRNGSDSPVRSEIRQAGSALESAAQQQEGVLAVPMRLRKHAHRTRAASPSRPSPIVRLSREASWTQRGRTFVRHLRYLAINARTLQAEASRAQVVCGSRNYCLRELEVFRELLGRHGRTPGGQDTRSHRPRRGLLPRQLSLGDRQ